MGIPLLKTKLYFPPPRPQERVVPRPRLTARLGEAMRLQHRLTLVSAKAGSGKTTVVQGPVAVLPAGARDKEAVGDLLAWMMSPEVQAEAMYAHASLPARRTAAQDPRFVNAPGFEVFVALMEAEGKGRKER
jgi:ABC-type thiamine transport system substrate-binding protein